MKYILILSLFLAGCVDDKPKFKVGDCISEIRHMRESWEERTVYKVLELGKHSYRIGYLDTNDLIMNYNLDSYNEKVECPK